MKHAILACLASLVLCCTAQGVTPDAFRDPPADARPDRRSGPARAAHGPKAQASPSNVREGNPS